MAYTGIESIKEAYANQLIENEEISRALTVADKDYITPIFTGGDVHPESVPNVDSLNEFFADICVDCAALKKETQSVAELYNSLINSIKLRLSDVDETLRREEERLQDINIICGNYKDFATIRTLTKNELGGNFSYKDDFTFSLYGQEIQIPVNITEVIGNGYEGNSYVVDENKNFIQDSKDTSNRNYMIDSSIITAYEYSRLTMSSKEKNYPKDANFDKVEAVCSVTFKSKQKFTSVKISCDLDSVIVKDVLISSDNGITFNSALIEKDVKINSIEKKYSDSPYIYGSGVISFEAANCVKIIFQSGDTTSEKIMYRKMTTTPKSKKTKTAVYDLPTAKRHLIRINNVEFWSGAYNKNGIIYTGNLIKNPVNCIAVFANEYVPSFFNSNIQYFKYVLTVNGIDYEVVPINSNRNGIKMIRFMDIVSTDSYVYHINESIKAAKLTVTIKTPDTNYTPYISNLKICLGNVA